MTKWDKLTIVAILVVVGLAFATGKWYQSYRTEQAVIQRVVVYYQGVQLRRCDYVYVERPMGGCAVVKIRRKGGFPQREELTITIDGRPNCPILLMDGMSDYIVMVAFGAS